VSRLRDAFRALFPGPELVTYQLGRYDAYEAVAGQIASYRNNKPTYPDADLTTLAGGQLKVALIARCVSLIADAAGVAPLRVYDEANDNAEIPDHPLRKRMRRPNPQMGPQRFMATIATRAALAGFCVIEKEFNNAGEVIALWPLEPDRCRAVLRSQSAPAWEYRLYGMGSQRSYTFEPEEVVHFTWRDRLDGSPYGIGALEPAIREMALLTQMTDFLKVLFEHGGVPLYGLIPEEYGRPKNQAEADAMQERFARRHGGLTNAAYPMILSGIKDVKQLTMDMQQLAMVAIRDLADLAICQAFGVPAHKAGTRAGLEHTTQNATAEVADGTFYRDTMIPFWSRLDEAFSTALLPDFLTPAEEARGTIALGFDTSDIAALQDDRNAKAAWLNQAVSGGFLTAHTWAKEVGLPVPDGDDFFLRPFTVEVVPASDPLGLIAVAEAEKKAAQNPPPLPPGTDAPQLGAGSSYERYAKRVKIGAQNKKAIGSLATKSKPKLATFFAAQSERILGKLDVLATTGDMERYTVANIDWQHEEAELEKVVRSLYQLAGQTAFTAVNDQLGAGLSFDLANPHLGKIRTLLANQVKGITDESRSIVQETVANGLTAGKSIPEIRDELTTRMGTWSTSRAATVSRTESMLAYGHASAAGYRASGVVDRIQCFDNPDHTDDYGADDGLSCADRNGLIDALESAELHLSSEHPNGSLAIAPILSGEDA
jgi:HK97 family phage portal protein